MSRLVLLSIAALTAACEQPPAPGSVSAKPSTSASATPSASPSAQVSAAPGPTASVWVTQPDGPPSGIILKRGEDLPTYWTPAEGSLSQPIPSSEGWSFSAPKDAKWPAQAPGEKKGWGTLSLGGKEVAVLMASPEQDAGDQCVKTVDLRNKLQDGGIGGSKLFAWSYIEAPSAKNADKTTTWGDTIEYVKWEKVEGQMGFYAHKVFDHGDDSTHICCTVGPADKVKDFSGLTDRAALDQMLAFCMSTTFTF